jgi:hypothetical protein
MTTALVPISQGNASGPLGKALDIIFAEQD